VQALCRRAGRDQLLPGFIKVAAIGTLADVVPLVGENRVIAKLGLDLLSKGPHKIGCERSSTSAAERQDDRQLSHRLHARARG
jgi:single-stranded-DNA-specific exonuclease